jgi:hypothetical protein
MRRQRCDWRQQVARPTRASLNLDPASDAVNLAERGGTTSETGQKRHFDGAPIISGLSDKRTISELVGMSQTCHRRTPERTRRAGASRAAGLVPGDLAATFSLIKLPLNCRGPQPRGRSADCAARQAASWRMRTGTDIARPMRVAVRLGDMTRTDAAPSQNRSKFGMRPRP